MMKSLIPASVSKVRTDITSYLFHFVNRTGAPADTLREILKLRYLRGGVYQPAFSKTVCFTEAPLAHVVQADGILDSHKYERLSLWGIGFKKRFVFEKGGLPVIYQPRGMLDQLKPEAYWRHVDFNPHNGPDFTWQREWRVECDEFHFEAEDAILVIPDVAAFARELWHVSIDIQEKHGEVSYDSGVFKNWDFVPLQHVDYSNDADIDVCKGEDFQDILKDGYYDDIEVTGP